jgi:hypothetical protein
VRKGKRERKRERERERKRERERVVGKHKARQHLATIKHARTQSTPVLKALLHRYLSYRRLLILIQSGCVIIYNTLEARWPNNHKCFCCNTLCN